MTVFPVRIFLFLCLAAVVLCPAVRGQSKGAADAAETAYAQFLSGDYAGAAAAYEKVLRDYPTDGSAPASTVQLGFAQFFLGEFDKALTTLNRALAGTPLPPDLAQLVDGFVPQILLAKAASLPASNPKRKATFQEAINKFTEFLSKYPQSPDIENAVFGRATAQFQIGNFDSAIEDLQSNIQKFSQSGTVARNKDLLALIWATQGSNEFSKSGGNAAKGAALLKQAEDQLRQILADNKDIALINDAYFQLGEILFAQAAFSPENERAPLFAKAMTAYRSILPKEEIISLQKERIAGYPAIRLAAVRASNFALKKQIDKNNENDIRKLQDIIAKPDQIATAFLKMGEIFFNEKKFNEARVLIQHALPSISYPEDKIQADYYLAMTYAVQNVKDKAGESCNRFFANYPNPPVAESLPFAVGNMFLTAGNAPMAIRYFDESISRYPNGRLFSLSIASKAQAQLSLKKFDDAQKTYEQCLASKPSPEIALLALNGLATMYKDTGRWANAIATYKMLIGRFPKSPQAIEAEYWQAACAQQNGDHAGAITQLQNFIKSHPGHPLVPLAAYAIGSAQIALGKTRDALDTMAKVAKDYPASTPAPYTYLARAQLLAAQQKPAEVNAILREFVKKYPNSDSVYYACEMMARNDLDADRTDLAIAAYIDFAKKQPASPNAPEALVRAAELQRSLAEHLALNFSSLSLEDQARWKKAVQQSSSTAEELIRKYPQSKEFALGLQALIAAQRMLLQAQVKDAAAVESSLQALATSCPDPAGKCRILFALAGFIFEKDKIRGLAKMNEVYNPNVTFLPDDLDLYGMALLADGKFPQAKSIYQKLAADYPVPPRTTPDKAPTIVQEAQATSLYGLACIAQAQHQIKDAGKIFQSLKTNYPWSPKVLEADRGIAESLRAEGKLDEAIKLLPGIIRDPNATAELRASAMLLGGFLMLDKMKKSTDPLERDNFRGAAIDYFIKISQFYSEVPVAAATGLWEGGQLLEEQANSISDPKAKSLQLSRAKTIFTQLVKYYPNSELTAKAQSRISALGDK